MEASLGDAASGSLTDALHTSNPGNKFAAERGLLERHALGEKWISVAEVGHRGKEVLVLLGKDRHT